MLRNTMRTPFLAALLGLSLVSCTTGEISGGGGDDDNPGGPTCGNGVVDQGEQCDGTAGCAADCTLLPVPKVDITVDHPTVATELNSSTMITVTARASGGFSGTVNLTAAAVDASDQPLPGWTVTLDAQSLNVGADSSSITVATLKIPSDSASLTGKVKITATAAGVTEGTLIASSEVTALNQVTIGMKLDNNGQCVYPPDGTLPIKVGSKLIFKNNQATTGNITIHMQTQNNDNTIGLKHEGDPGMAPGATYEQTVQNASANLVTWYCHAPGPTVNGLKIQAVP